MKTNRVTGAEVKIVDGETKQDRRTYPEQLKNNARSIKHRHEVKNKSPIKDREKNTTEEHKKTEGGGEGRRIDLKDRDRAVAPNPKEGPRRKPIKGAIIPSKTKL